MPNLKTRCAWCSDDPLYIEYHDTEWGFPVYDEQRLFEFLILEGAQAGLSWLTILKKRENYRQAFDRFVPEKIACYTPNTEANLLQNPGIIRNRLKIASTIQNARALCNMKQAGIDFSHYLWNFVDGKPIKNHWKTLKEVPAKTALSDALSKDLKKRGFNFIGSTICYAFMQAVGMVNDHTIDCFCY